MNNNSGSRTFLLLGVFAVAMGFLEAIVVVYLRELYYPSGFGFPLTSIPARILLAEILREACTIVMLVSLAAVAGRGTYMRLSYFLYVFGVWDVFYYIGLKLLLGWPPSLFTWDILFLIPVTWLAPVLAPVTCALTMILMGLLLAYLVGKCSAVRAGAAGWGLAVLGAAVIFYTFISDYARIIVEGGLLRDVLTLRENPEFIEMASSHVPVHYNWPLFALGEAMILYALILMYRKTLGACR
jgi:hypothetical protein